MGSPKDYTCTSLNSLINLATNIYCSSPGMLVLIGLVLSLKAPTAGVHLSVINSGTGGMSSDISR